MDALFAVVFFAVAAWFVFRATKFGGLRGAVFGARIQRTVGEVLGARRSFLTTVLRVHILEGGPEEAVGIEIVSKGFAAYRMTPITLSLVDARTLIGLLQSAIPRV